jgi:hypothetical protein
MDRPTFDIRETIAAGRARGLSDAEIGYLFEPSAAELAAIDGGDARVWEAKVTPEYRDRLAARLRTKAAGSARRGGEAQRGAAQAQRVFDLLDAAGVPDGMTVADAIAAGLVSQEAVERAFGDE